MSDVAARPAEGERAAVVGFSGQYGLAARTVRAKITTLEWIRVADPDAGVADDFQFQAGGTRYALQVKWAQYPGAFGWAELVNASRDATPLIGRLAQAWQRIRENWSGPLEVRLWSNENPSVSAPREGSVLASCSAQPPRHFAAFLARSWIPARERLRAGSGTWSQVATLPEVTAWQSAWEALRMAAGLDVDAFAAFVGDLDLHFGPAVEDQLLRPDEAPRDSDLEHLAATLQALVADPARPIQLSREELLERLGWTDRLRFRNPHAFPIPASYTANEAARRQLQVRLDELRGGYVALVGPAGAGKSTLLASLTWPQRRVVRYYAFVPDASDPLSGRGEADSFLHDVSLALEGVGFRRRGYGNDLRTQRAVLQEQLADAGERWRDSEEATVIVVDGLDHIPREQNPSRSLLEELPAPAGIPEGVFVVLGTQTTGILPRPIRDALATDDRTVELPPLAPGEVLRLADAAGPGEWLHAGQRERLVAASEGHPLALTYLLQDLAALESAESDPQLRSLAVDALLSDASAYGREVEVRYRGYLLALGDDRELLDVVAAIARLRTPVDLEWLKTWVATPVLEAFVQRTATFFRREGTVWRFIHNSFRRFLIEETSRVAGTFDAGRDRALHVALADICGRSDQRWTLYRDEELAHRYLAGDYARVIELARPNLLRDKILALRPIAVVLDQARLALRAAAETDDHANFVRMLLFHNEVWQRELVISPEKLASVMVYLGPPERALEHVVAAGLLRVPVEAALDVAVRFARAGSFEAAAQILRAAGSLAEIVSDKPASAADWAEVTFHISGLDEVLAQLDDQLTVPTAGPVPDDPPAALDDEAKWAAERRRRDHEERIAQMTSARNVILARCFDLLNEIRDETGLTTLRDRIDREPSSGWRARARVVHAIAACEDGDASSVLRWSREVIELHTVERDDEHDEEDGSPTSRTGGVPLSLRLRAAHMLVASGLIDAPELDLLVPPDTVAAWPSVPSGQDGLTPFRTIIDLAKLRVLHPATSAAPTGVLSTAVPNPRGAGNERFRRALNTLAQLEGRQAAADIGRGSAPNVAAEADPIIRLLEVPNRQTWDWTGWYYVQAAAPGLFRRLARLAAAGGPDTLHALLDRFAAAWNDPHRAKYWSPQRQLHVLRAVLSFAKADVVDRVRDHLERLDTAIEGLASGPHELAEVWLEQAKGWSKARNLQRAEEAVRSALRASWGPGFHHDDRQLTAWLDWLRAAAADGVLEREEFLEAARCYAGRLVAANDADADKDAAEAAGQLIQMVWPVESALSTALAESLCETGIIEEDEAIEAVLLGGARDPRVPVELAAVAAAELLIPLRRQPSHELRRTIEQRLDPQTPHAVAIIDDAIAVWSVPDDPDSPSSDGSDSASPTAASTEPDDVPALAASPTSVTALLNEMRRTPHAGAEPRDWGRAVEAVAGDDVTRAVAGALLNEASRLRLDGEALGGIAAMAARAGLAQTAAGALADALARTPAYGWLPHYDGGSRLNLLRAALRHRDPTIARLAASDLAGALSTGALSGQIQPTDLRRILETIAGKHAVASAWQQVAEHLDVYAPAAHQVPGPSEPVAAASTPVEALLRWVAGYLGHPVRPRDFGARHVLHAGLDMALPEAETVLAESNSLGGWQAEAALHTLAVYGPPRAALSSALSESIATAAASDDAICRDLARQLCERHGLAAPVPPLRPLARTYELALPPLRARTAPETDSRGVPMIDMHDPQQILAPFDEPLRLAARLAGLPEEATLHRAATIAIALDMPWLRGGHQAHATRLETRGQRHTYRPWAFMAGRRALGIVLAELLDAGALDRGIAAPSYAIGLIDEVLVHVVPKPLDDTTPAPWRAPTDSSYDVRGWCKQTEDAARTYATAAEVASTYVLAESTEWVRLEWGKPEEYRTIQTAHGLADAGGVLLPSRELWEKSFKPANGYSQVRDLAWTDEQLVVEGWEMHTDPPWYRWLALHPAVGRHLGWTPNPTELFCWNGDDGTWRARSIRRARGQLSHQPYSHAYCAEGWQVVLSDTGLAELRQAFGPLRRHLLVQRTLPARPREDRPAAETSRFRVSLTEPS
ncbi:ATP-binding protein [Micromonospora fulviviridis]|uniref:ATP-binding protein n=1 Tax=Micromonospora fulviviridis TaxID=47860 RepID=UPI0016699F98|nr:ATP-binding protein [Micromonospora fulviviridis]